MLYVASMDRPQKRAFTFSSSAMGNIIGNVQKKFVGSSSETFSPEKSSNMDLCSRTSQMGGFTPVKEFKFMEPFDDSTNGLYLNDIFLPEEVVRDILGYIPPNKLLELTLVCKKWCNIIKSENFWMNVYNRQFPNKAKKLPWYIFYCYFTTDNFKNLLKNGNGQEKFKYWKIMRNGGDRFQIEKPPHGADPLPLAVPDFQGFTSCFATSYTDCTKIQEICLENKRLLRYILNKFRPNIYSSEWVAGRFDCGCKYKLTIRGYNQDYAKLYGKKYGNMEAELLDIDEDNGLLFNATKGTSVEQWQGKEWEKVEITVPFCPPDVHIIVFEHSGKDTQFWKGHYGSKMAGGILRVAFESIEPLKEDCEETLEN